VLLLGRLAFVRSVAKFEPLAVALVPFWRSLLGSGRADGLRVYPPVFCERFWEGGVT
jgi:hypothetical protein